jgi:hypothetical protein
VALERTGDITPRVVVSQTCRDTLVPLLQAVPGCRLRRLRAACRFFRLDDATRFDSLDVAAWCWRSLGWPQAMPHGQPDLTHKLAALVFRQSGHRALGWGVELPPLAGYNPRLKGCRRVCV